MVDGDGLKYQRPPPLNYPDAEDTPDFETYDNWKSPEFKYLHDAGLLKDPYAYTYLDSSKLWTARKFIINGQESISLESPSNDIPIKYTSSSII